MNNKISIITTGSEVFLEFAEKVKNGNGTMTTKVSLFINDDKKLEDYEGNTWETLGDAVNHELLQHNKSIEDYKKL